MKILYITATPLEYNSSANMRNIALIKGLEELGNEVSTLSSDFCEDSIYIESIESKVKLKDRYWIKLGQLQSNITNKVNSKNKFKKKVKEKLYKIYTKFSIYDPRKTLTSKIKKGLVNSKFDLIISSSDPKSSHLLAEKIIQLNPDITKMWIQYWGDPFCGDINRNTIIPDFFIKREEKRLIKKCDKVVYVSPFTLERQQKIYKEYKEKMVFVPIPFLKEKVYKNVKNEKVVLGYFGDYNSKDRNINHLYNVVKENIKLELNICGNSDITLKEKENIKIKTRQKTSILTSLEEVVDILICICNRSGTQIPGKIYHYAATNKPILIILDGQNRKELKRYFEGFDRFELCNNNEKDIEKAILNIINSKKNYKPSDLLEPKHIAQNIVEMFNNREE